MTWNAYSNRFRFVKCSNCAIIVLGNFDGIASSLVYSDETTWHPRWKIPLENLWKHHFRDSNFQNISTIYASSPKNFCLWCELQSYLLFIIRLLLRNLFDSPVCWIVICPRDNAIQCLNKQGLGEEKVEQNFQCKEIIQY